MWQTAKRLNEEKAKETERFSCARSKEQLTTAKMSEKYIQKSKMLPKYCDIFRSMDENAWTSLPLWKAECIRLVFSLTGMILGMMILVVLLFVSAGWALMHFRIRICNSRKKNHASLQLASSEAACSSAIWPWFFCNVFFDTVKFVAIISKLVSASRRSA